MNPNTKQTLKFTTMLLALIFALAPLGFASANEGISATITAAEGEFTVGDRIPLYLTVTHPNGDRLLPLQFQDQVWGELEILEISSPQVVSNPDGTETTTQTIYATLWAPGVYTTPELPLTISDTTGEIHPVNIDPLDLSITSVLVEGDTTLRDIKPQASLPLPAIWPWVVGGLFVVLLVAVVAGWLLRRWWLRRKAALANTPDLRLPHEVALDELTRIAGLNLPPQHRFKEHYTLISDVLRGYVEKSFQIPTLDRTTYEIRRSLKLAPFNQDNKRLLIEMLNQADLVKFAKVHPKISSAQNYLIQARRFVDQTRPPEVVTGNGGASNDGNKAERFELRQDNTPLMEAK
jgi:hypothetical protein